MKKLLAVLGVSVATYATCYADQVKETVASLSLADLKKFMSYMAEHDTGAINEAFTTKMVFMLKAGEVSTITTDGEYAKIRPRGQTTELWVLLRCVKID